MMMRTWKVVIGLVLAVGLSPSWVAAETAVQGGAIGSGERGSSILTYTMRSTSFPSGQNAISGFGKDTLIYGFKTVPNNTALNAYCTLYDATTVVGAADSTVIDELPEYNNARGASIQMWPFPFRLTTGLSIGASNATCIVYYR